MYIYIIKRINLSNNLVTLMGAWYSNEQAKAIANGLTKQNGIIYTIEKVLLTEK